jgi:hypothetical protein
MTRHYCRALMSDLKAAESFVQAHQLLILFLQMAADNDV